MRQLDPTEIRRSLVNCSRTRAAGLSVPPAADVDWANRDYFGWRDAKAPLRAYLVVDRNPSAVGIELRLPASGLRTGRSAVCNLCRCTQPSDSVLLFSAAKASRSGNSVGTYICADLACSLYLRGLLPLERPYGQDSPLEDRVEGLSRRLEAFVDVVLNG
jgi:hypothetical protein